MKLGLQLGIAASDPAQALALVQQAEQLGFDSVWTSEAYGSDAVSPAAWILGQTRRRARCLTRAGLVFTFVCNCKERDDPKFQLFNCSNWTAPLGETRKCDGGWSLGRSQCCSKSDSLTFDPLARRRAPAGLLPASPSARGRNDGPV